MNACTYLYFLLEKSYMSVHSGNIEACFSHSQMENQEVLYNPQPWKDSFPNPGRTKCVKQIWEGWASLKRILSQGNSE